MKISKLFIYSLLLTIAFGQYGQSKDCTYEKDYLGRTVKNCKDGTKGTFDTDYLGRKTYKDNKGRNCVYEKDYLGRTVLKCNDY